MVTILKHIFWKVGWLFSEMLSLFIKLKPIVLLGSENKTFTGNSKYLFLYLYEIRDTLPFEFYYICPTKELYTALQDKYQERAIYKKSFRCWSLIMKARYGFITHGTYNLFFFVLKRIIIINLWHGMPLKKLGHDATNNTITKRLKIRALLGFDEFKRWDYFIADAPHFVPRIHSAMKLPAHKILPLGQPRNDYLCNHLNNVNYINSLKLQILGRNDCKIILYAPTYRDNSEARDTFYQEVQKLCSHLASLLTSTNSCLLLKLHPYDADRLNINAENITLVSDSIDSHDLLLVSDVLITDYSSLMYDFALTRRPILLYVFDYARYSIERGLYEPLKNLGYMCMVLTALIEQLSLILKNQPKIEDTKLITTASKKIVEQLLLNGHGSSNQ